LGAEGPWKVEMESIKRKASKESLLAFLKDKKVSDEGYMILFKFSKIIK
jgi:hypothetical protein